MVVSFSFCSVFAELDRFLRAPLEASQAMLAVMEPNRFILLHFDILDRTDLFADAAAIALFIRPIAIISLV